MKNKTNCDSCVYCVYDDEYNYYECTINLDQDEMEKFITNTYYSCPYFRFYDEYKTVKKQN